MSASSIRSAWSTLRKVYHNTNGFNPRRNAMACTCTACNHQHDTHNDRTPHADTEDRHNTIRFATAALFFIAGSIITVAFDTYNFTLSFGSLTLSITLSALFFIASWLAAGLEVLQTFCKTIGRGSIFDENFLMTVATLGAFILGQWSEGAAVMLFYNLGELVQAAAVQKSRQSIINAMDLRPTFVRLYRKQAAAAVENEADHDSHMNTDEHCGTSGTEHGMDKHTTQHNQHAEVCDCTHKGEQRDHHSVCSCAHHHTEGDADLVTPDAVPIGTLILVKAGEKVPLDGILIEGACSFDTSSMTGESLSRFICEGEPVLAGFVNLDGLAVIKTTVVARDTAAAKMLQLVEEAQERKAKTERLISSFARIYTPIVTVSAVVLALLPPIVSSLLYSQALTWNSFVPWISRGLVFLVISCPCAFVISVPLGYFGGLGGAAKKGILIKGADFIDSLAKTDTVVFDKTGTLTTGVLTVQEIIPSESFESEVFLTLAYMAEYHSNHPIAHAVKRSIQGRLGTIKISDLDAEAAKIQHYTEKAGSGVTMLHKGQRLTAGSAAFIFKDTCTQPKNKKDIDRREGIKVFFSYGDTYAGCIICNDSIKPQAAQAVRELRESGVGYLEMLTGDVKRTGEKIAAELNLDRCSSELLPHEKVARFECISTERKQQNRDAVCIFVGDGINDAPALARADVGIAMGAIGSDAAIEAADVVLMNDNPQLIAQAISLARFTRKIVKQNIIMSFAVKIAFLAGGAIGLIGLWAAVFADVGVALLAVCNALRARRV